MTEDNSGNIELSRRKALMGLGGIGIAGAVGGYGTQALFSDTEQTSGTFSAGELDLQIGYEVGHYGNDVSGVNPVEPTNMDGSMGIELNDIKPGDSGWIRFSILNNDNPAWVWFRGRLSDSGEGGTPDAEMEAEGSPGQFGELDEHLQFRSFYDQNQDGTVNDPSFTNQATPNLLDDRYIQFPLDLKEQDDGSSSQQYGSTPVLLDGVRTLDGNDLTAAGAYPDGEPIDPFANGATQYVKVNWELPTSVGNEVQGDTITVNFDFYAEQSRHNPEERFRGTDNSGDTNVNFTSQGAANDTPPENPWSAEYQSAVFDPQAASPSTSGLVLGPEPDNGEPDSNTGSGP